MNFKKKTPGGPAGQGGLDLALTPATLIKKSTVVYGAMTAAGLLFVAFGHKTLAASFALPSEPMEILRLLAIGLLGGGLLLVLSYFFEDWFTSFRELKSAITQFLGPCSVGGALYLAVITSVGEELLFRGAIQPFAGLVLTSILFGLLHMGQDGLISSWSIWALIAGLLLGWMYEETGSLWPPIVAHFMVNAVSILNLRRTWRGFLKDRACSTSGQSGPAADREDQT